MMCRGRLWSIVFVALFSGTAVWWAGPRPAAVERPMQMEQSTDSQLAARWYHRARRGRLFYRSTPAGRKSSHTLRPGQIA